jgi:hypothetical protein
MMRRLVVSATILVCTACSLGETKEHGTVVVDTIGDTVASVTSERVSRQVASEPTVLLRDDRLYLPRSITKHGGRLIVGDHTEVWIIDLATGDSRIVGRQGEGPGEYQSVGAVTSTSSGNILVLDDRLDRLTVLDTAGVYRSSQQLNGPDVLGIPEVDRLQAFQGGVITVWKSGVVNPGGEPLDVAVTWESPDGEMKEVTRLKDVDMVDGGRMIIPRNPYGARPLTALGPRGLVATSDGLDYCVVVRRVGETEIRRLCRRWQRSMAEKDPSVNELRRRVDVADMFAVALESRLSSEELDYKNSIENMLFDSSGNLWIQVLQPDTRYSIMVRYPWPELRPEYYTWDVINPRGHLVAEVSIQSRFTPFVIERGRLFGTLVLESGELAIARVEVDLHN